MQKADYCLALTLCNQVLLSLPACREALAKYNAARAKAKEAKSQEQQAAEPAAAAADQPAVATATQDEAAPAALSPELQAVAKTVTDLQHRLDELNGKLKDKESKVAAASEATASTKVSRRDAGCQQLSAVVSSCQQLSSVIKYVSLTLCLQVSTEITTSSAHLAMEQIAARLDDQEDRLAQLSALSAAGGATAPPASEVESIKAMIDDARTQATETKVSVTCAMTCLGFVWVVFLDTCG